MGGGGWFTAHRGGLANFRYVVLRIAQAALVLWAAFTVAYFILFQLPGDPVLTMLSAEGGGGFIDPELIEDLRQRYRLDEPVVVQYFNLLQDAIGGDLGTSIRTGQPVVTMLGNGLSETWKLAVAALVVALLVGSTLSYIACYTRKPWLRQAIIALPPIGVSVPTFWVGLLLLQVVSFQLGLLPAVGSGGWQTLVLPVLTLALPATAIITQVFEKSLSSEMRQPYIGTALAKGATRTRAINRHALRNAAISCVTVVGLLAGQLLSGAVVVEIVFARPGLGRITAEAVASQDIPVVLGIVLLGAAIYTILSLVVDLLYPLIDPRLMPRLTVKSA